jgi:hypothetical protein
MSGRRLFDAGPRGSGTLAAAPAVLLAIALIGFSAPASAQQVAQPGNSAADQYTETVPTTGGGAPSEGVGGQTPAEALGKPNAERLEATGEDGRAAADLAASTAPAPPAESAASTPAEDPGSRGAPDLPAGSSPAEGSSALEEIIPTGVSSSGEMGIVLPLVFLGAVLAAAAVLWRRRQLT